MSDPARLVVLGIDAASPELLERWAADGTMPALGSLLARGTVARIRGLDGFYVGSTWPSLSTGTGPGRHGVHYLAQIPAGGTEYRRVADGALLRGVPFWATLSESGRRVAVLDVPLSRLTPGLNGMQTVEWGSHDALYGFQAWPEVLEREIRERHGLHPLGPTCDGVRRSAREVERLVARLVAGVGAKARLSADLLARGGWDLFAQVFTEAHCAGHQLWHVHDPTHPGHDPAVASEVGDPLRTVYAAIDAELGSLVEQAGDATVVVFTAHGMASAHGAQLLLPEVLERLGVAAPKPAGARPSLGARAVGTVARRLPTPVRRRAAAVRSRLAGTGPQDTLPTIPVDVGRSACFPVANGLAVGAIRLNLAGREPHGTLAPASADGFCETLAADLLELVDERTGRPAIRRVLRTAELYEGDRLGDLPDVLVEWADDVPTGSATVGTGNGAGVALSSPRIGVIEGTNRWSRSGEHRRDGLLVAAGPGLGAGRLEHEVDLREVAPTLCAMLGVDLPEAERAPVAELVPR